MGPVGRASRLLFGGLFVLIAAPAYIAIGTTIRFLGSTYSSDYGSISLTVVSTFGFLAFYLLVHRLASTRLRSINQWLGAAMANLPPLVVFIAAAAEGIGFAQIAVFTYVGLAMLLAGWKKDQGCEVMSPANILLGHRTHFACIVFSPIDWVEAKARSSFTRNSTNAAALGIGIQCADAGSHDLASKDCGEDTR